MIKSTLAKEKVAKRSKSSSSKRKDFIDKFTKNLKIWDRELEEMEKKRDQKVAALKENLNGRISNLRAKRSKLEKKMELLEDAGEEVFESLKKDIEAIWKDLKSGYKSIQKVIKK